MKKSPDAFRTISEVADWLGVPTHVLRFWESRFAQVKPVKRAGGRRYYRPTDMELLGGIKRLLHDDGMTIRGVQKLLRDEGIRHVSGMSQPLFSDVEDAEIIDEVATPVDADVVEFPGTDAKPDAQPSEAVQDVTPETEPEPELESEEASSDEPSLQPRPDATPEETDIVPGADAEADEVEDEKAATPVQDSTEDVGDEIAARSGTDPDEDKLAPAEASDFEIVSKDSDLLDLMSKPSEQSSAAPGPLIAPDAPDEDPEDDDPEDDGTVSVAARLRIVDLGGLETASDALASAHARLVALRARMDDRNQA